MIRKIWITRDTGSGLISRGLGQVFVWFHEPCLEIDIANDDPFGAENDLQDNLRHQLEGVLFSPNLRHNFLYRESNDVKSKFGEKIIRNSDGIDLPIELVELYRHRKLRFHHEVFGSGQKVGYRPNSVANIFGFDNPISAEIWSLVIKDFQNTEVNAPAILRWSRLEEAIPWWGFCKQLEIEINLR